MKVAMEAPEFIFLYVGYSFEPHGRCKEHTSRTTSDIGIPDDSQNVEDAGA